MFLKRGNNFLKNRSSLTIDEIYEGFFKEKRIGFSEFCAIWLQIAKILKIEYGLLRPTDRFEFEIACDMKKSDRLEDLSEWAAIEMDKIPLRYQVHLCDMDDLSELVSVLVKKKSHLKG